MQVLVVLLALMAAGAAAHPAAAPTNVLFVCEHGAAKSVIASVYFNKLAAERGMPYRATYRGANPQKDLSKATVAGLKDDQLPVPAPPPQRVTQRDVDEASHVVTLGCKLPKGVRSEGKLDDWSDIPEIAVGYATVRDAIRLHIEHLLDQMQKQP